MGRLIFATACVVYASNLLPCAHCMLAIGYCMHSVCQQLATACTLYANNLLLYPQSTLANFYAQTTLAIATVNAVNASNLLPYLQCMLANCYPMRSVPQQFATVSAVYANKADHMLTLPIQLNQILTNEKSKKSKKHYFDTFKWTSNESETMFFCVLTQSQKIIASVHFEYASKEKMIHIWPIFKKIIYFSPQVPYLQTLHDIKIIEIEEIKNLTLGHL